MIRLLRACACVLAIAPVQSFAAPPPLEIYGQLPGFAMATLSPSGNHVAVLATVDNVRQIVVFDADRNVVQRFPISAKVRRLRWVGDDMVMIEASATVGLNADYTIDKLELTSVIVVPLNGSKPWGVFADTKSVASWVEGEYGVARKDGRWFGYFGGITTERGLNSDHFLPNSWNPDLYEVDLQTHTLHKIASKIQGPHDWRGWLLDDKGAIGAVLDFTYTTGEWVVTNGQRQTLASGVDRLGEVGLVGFTADGTGVIYDVRDANGKTQWYSVPLAGGTPQVMLKDTAVERKILDQGHRLIGYVEHNADETAHFFNPHDEKVYTATQHNFPKLRVVFDDANSAFDHLLVKTEGAGDPETWWLINLATKHADPLGVSYDVPPEQVGPMRMVPYTAADGLKMEGVLTLPPDRPAKALPAVMLPHGGPAAYDELRFDWIAQAFASRGYAVFQPNFRGSTGYGNAFEDAGHGEWGRKMQTDISDGLNELVREGLVDPKRVCIVGASYGGYAALAGVTLQHGIYRCAVADAGISDVARMVTVDAAETNDDLLLMRWLKRELGSGRNLKAVSPINFVSTIDAPVLLIHGKDDTVVHFDQSTDMLDAMRRAGKPVEMVTLKAEDHWLSHSATRLQMLQASVDFVIKYNPPDAAPAAAKVP